MTTRIAQRDRAMIQPVPSREYPVYTDEGLFSAYYIAYTIRMRYDWDETKREANIAKHGVDFTAAEDFEWDVALVIASHSATEPRLVAIAPIRRRLHVLVYSIETRIVRIISLRKANRREAKLYEAQT